MTLLQDRQIRRFVWFELLFVVLLLAAGLSLCVAYGHTAQILYLDRSAEIASALLGQGVSETAIAAALQSSSIALNTESLLQMPVWAAGLFLMALGCVLSLAYLVTRRWFQQSQQVRDEARAGWINGVSHDIRTPLSVVMGYAAQMEEDSALPPDRRRQASAIRAQSQVIRDLVNDLNLTMRLDCAMQALREERLQPAALLRRTAADFLNGGLAEGFPVEVELPSEPLPDIEADEFLLRRAVNNLLTNCVRHNAPGCAIRMGGRVQADQVVLWVEGGQAAQSQSVPSRQLEEDGGAAHGTGLRLVAQIAAAHGGKTRFFKGAAYRCELWLPAARP